jgi:hypothetical protein
MCQTNSTAFSQGMPIEAELVESICGHIVIAIRFTAVSDQHLPAPA